MHDNTYSASPSGAKSWGRRQALFFCSISGLALAAALSPAAMAQEETFSTDAELTEDSYAGVLVTSGANVTGSGVAFAQSSNFYGVLVSQGSVTLDGGSITQSGTGKYVTGVGVVDGSANVSNLTITIDGAKDAGALYSNHANGQITGSNLTVDFQAAGSTTAEPASAVKARAGTVSTSNSTFQIAGDTVFGLLASGNNGNQPVVESTGDMIVTSGARGYGAFAFSDEREGSSGDINITGGSITTGGATAYALAAQGAGATITADSGFQAITGGDGAHGAYAYRRSEIGLTDVSIDTSGAGADGAVAAEGGTLTMTGGSIETSGSQTAGARARSGGAVTLTGANIVTRGIHAYGAHAVASDGSPTSITLSGGSILAANETGRGSQQGDGSRGYALFSEGAGATVSATGTSVGTLGQRAYGAYAIDGGAVDLSGLSISTEGFMAYGVYASGPGSIVTANNVDVTTSGQAGDAAWAYNGGRTNLNGGVYTVLGERNPIAPNETANGLVAVGGLNGANEGVISANGVTLVTHGAGSIGALAGDFVGADRTSGRIALDQSSITVNGAGATAARVAYGSALTAANTTLASAQGAGVHLVDNATVTLTGTTVTAAQETFVSTLDQAGQAQTITVGSGTVATENNGVLLRVDRQGDGSDGVVGLTLGAGSTTRGDIIDTGTKTGAGATNVALEAGADWSGVMQGVGNFEAAPGGDIAFEDEAEIEGDLTGEGTNFTFSDTGGSVGGNVSLQGGSQTTGGSIATPILVAGNIDVDGTSIMGGNWNVGGNLVNAGTITPGNSIGVVTVVGDVTFAPGSVYEVEIAADGASDLIAATGAASILGGTVQVATLDPLTSYQAGQAYTILTATDGVNGTFDALDHSAFLDISLTYAPEAVGLLIAPDAPPPPPGEPNPPIDFTSVAGAANQMQAAYGAQYLDQSGDALAVYNAILPLSAAEARGAFDALSGEIHASARHASLEAAGLFQGTLARRAGSLTGSAAGAAERTDSGLAVWGAALAEGGDIDADGNAAALEHRFAGVAFGAEGGREALGGVATAGIAAGFLDGRASADGRISAADISTWHAGLYGALDWGALRLSGAASYAEADLDTTRVIAWPGLAPRTADAQRSESLWSATLEASYRLPGGPAGFSFAPLALLDYVSGSADAAQETGAGALDLTVAEKDFTRLEAGAGFAAAQTFDLGGRTLTAEARAAYRHRLTGSVPVQSLALAGAPGVSYAAFGPDAGPDRVTLGLSLAGQVTERLSLRAAWDGSFAGDSEAHQASIVASWSF